MRHTHDTTAGLSDRERSCSGKLKLSEEDAKRGAKSLHKKYHKQFEAYACRYCGPDVFHVGQRAPKALRIMPLDSQPTPRNPTPRNPLP